MKRQHLEWELIFANYLFDKNISRLKNSYSTIIKMTSNPIKRWMYNFNRYFSEATYMPSKHTKRCSVLLPLVICKTNF